MRYVLAKIFADVKRVRAARFAFKIMGAIVPETGLHISELSLYMHSVNFDLLTHAMLNCPNDDGTKDRSN